MAELPRTLGAAEPALRTLNAAFPPVRRLIRDARPAVRSTDPTLDAAVPLVRQVRGLVSEPELRGLARDLRPVVPPLTALEKRTVPLLEQVRSASSCQNEVVLPWSHDTIADKAFPAQGPVYEEATKPLPGLAGESRSGDANGQWFRVLVTAPKIAYPLGADRFLFAGNPIQGVNPPVPQNHKRSPLRPDVPCETQAAARPAHDPADAARRASRCRRRALDQLQQPLEDARRRAAHPDPPAGPRPEGLGRPRQAPGADPVRRAIRKHARDFAAIVALAALAAVVGGYVLAHQRLRFPWEGAPFRIKAEFATAQAVTPGQGQTVRMSGVRVGDITKVDLEDGRAVVTMDLDPGYKGFVHTDAGALLRPKTGLKDMFIELDPGSGRAPRAKAGWTVPIRNTAAGRQPRRDLLRPRRRHARLPQAADRRRRARACAGAGATCATSSAASSPRTRDLERVNGAVAERHRNLRRLVHSLDVLNAELADKDDELAALVGLLLEGVPDVRRRAAEPRPRRAATCPARSARRPTRWARSSASRASCARRPTTCARRVKALDRANAQVEPLAEEATPIVREQIRPFVRDARPLVRALKAPATDLAAATPDLTSTFTALNHFLNLAGYNEKGRQGPSVAGRDEGYLFWLAWLQHNGAVAVLELRRQRPLPPGDARRDVQRPRSSRARTRR